MSKVRETLKGNQQLTQKNPQISNKHKVTLFLHFIGKSPFSRFPDTEEKSVFDADWSGSLAGSVRKWRYSY